MKTRRVVLIGFSGAGKSTVGRTLAQRLGWRLIDTDTEIAAREERSIPEIFRQDGESYFRQVEREVMRTSLEADNAVIATGGGAVANEEIWRESWLGSADTLTVLLEAPAEALHARLVEQQARDPEGTLRPMLEGDDPLARIASLKAQREPWYRRARVVIPVENRSVDEVVSVIASAASPETRHAVTLDVPGGRSEIRIQRGALAHLGDVIAERWPRARRVWVIADDAVARWHLDSVASAVGATADVRTLTFPPGESSKSIAGLSALYDGLLGGGIERSDVIVALGGGVAGDLVGFAAATVLRGVGLVQLPTTLLAMVDSSVGGKTGINHAAGKNLIGAFYQPPAVLIDPAFLETLPEREYRSGWAEIIKHGLIEPSTPAGDSGLLNLVRENAGALASGWSPLLPAVIARNVEIKASVVQADERESGLRAILNLGHTIGHAIEAAGYELLHGEAVAVGLHGAMRLAVAMDRIPESRALEVAETLTTFGLPTEVHADVERVRRLMRSDKKRVSGEQRWIVPEAEGGVSIERGVAPEAVDAALDAVVRP